jgi:mRNA interferase MazF
MVVISSARFHQQRPDAIIGLLTTNLAAATTNNDYVLQETNNDYVLQETNNDYVLQDWKQAGLRKPSAFRTYLGMEGQADLQIIGHLSSRDWQGVEAAVRGAIG